MITYFEGLQSLHFKCLSLKNCDKCPAMTHTVHSKVLHGIKQTNFLCVKTVTLDKCSGLTSSLNLEELANMEAIFPDQPHEISDRKIQSLETESIAANDMSHVKGKKVSTVAPTSFLFSQDLNVAKVP